MNNLFDTRIPQQDFHKTFRLISNNGVNYFGSDESVVFSPLKIDEVDPSIRILVYFASNEGCKIHSFFSGFYYSKEELKDIWNNIKKEEKQIRDKGLPLNKFDNSTVVFQDPSYRTYWPSFEAFSQEYENDAHAGWIVLDILALKKNTIKAITYQKDLFDKFVTINNYSKFGYEQFSFSFNVQEAYSHELQWRRITETLAQALINKL